MARNAFSSLLLLALFALAPVKVEAYDSKAHAKAASTIAAACMWWQVGKIPRSKIMATAQDQYRKNYGNPNNIDWNKAIKIAEMVDKQQGLGCFR